MKSFDDECKESIEATKKKFASVTGTVEELQLAYNAKNSSRIVYWCGALTKATGDLAEDLLATEAFGLVPREETA